MVIRNFVLRPKSFIFMEGKEWGRSREGENRRKEGEGKFERIRYNTVLGRGIY